MDHLILETPQFTASLDCRPILSIEVTIFETLLKFPLLKWISLFLFWFFFHEFLVQNAYSLTKNWKEQKYVGKPSSTWIHFSLGITDSSIAEALYREATIRRRNGFR